MKFYNEVRSKIGPHRQGGFDYIFDYLKTIENPLIVETGCARAEDNYYGDGQSSLLFDAYVSEYGGEFWTVDISQESVDYCRKKVSSKSNVVQEDSITFLKQFNSDLTKQNKKIDFLYLDSFDAPRENPQVLFMSALHHLYEFTTILPSLKPGTLVGVDDCWMEGNMVSGKGKFVTDYMNKIMNAPVYAGYQFFWKI
jgi:hypothetical protein